MIFYIILFVLGFGGIWLMFRQGRINEKERLNRPVYDFSEPLSIELGVVEEKEDEVELPEHAVLPHLLFAGSGGTGKTTLAQVTKNELENIYGHEIHFHAFTPSQLDSVQKLDRLMFDIKPYDVVFIDEIHRLKPAIAESFYQALEGGYYHVTGSKQYQLAEGLTLNEDDQTFKTITLPLFTCIGGTTDIGDLPKPFISRFIRINLTGYDESELELIVRSRLQNGRPDTLSDYIGQSEAVDEIIMHLNAIKYGSYDSFEITTEAEKMIAKRSFRNPRNAIKLLERCKNYALSKDSNRIDEDLVLEYTKKRGIDEYGLNSLYRHAVKVLIKEFPREVSTNALVEQLNIAKSDLENNIFPDLVSAGLAKRSPRSWRQATEKAIEKYGGLLDA